MSQKIGVINYGVAGNIRSIKKALEKIGAEVVVVNEAGQLDSIDKIVLPGVGSYPDAMKELSKAGFISPLMDVIGHKPTLGICLGMQILSRVGFEFEKSTGLGVFDAEVKPIECDGRIPHMGFNQIKAQRDSALLKGLDGAYFYFMHSFELVNYKNILALTQYCQHEFVSAIQKDNVFGVQFHPEKSRDQGLELFKNFVSM